MSNYPTTVSVASSAKCTTGVQRSICGGLCFEISYDGLVKSLHRHSGLKTNGIQDENV
jgi:hypothetical protein